MGKFYGKVGFTMQEETALGVWREHTTEREYFGDLLRGNLRHQSSDKLNDDINIVNEISIVSDPFALENFQFIRYVEYIGMKWKVTNIEIQYPRLILTVGGVYNEEQS